MVGSGCKPKVRDGAHRPRIFIYSDGSVHIDVHYLFITSNNCKELLFRKNIFCSSSFYIYIKTSKSGMKFCQSRFMNILVNHQNYRNVPKRAVILCSHKDLHILGNIQTYFIHTIFKWQFNSYFISKYSLCLY